MADGLVTEVAPADTFQKSVDVFTSRLAALAPLATRGNKAALAGIEGRSLAEHLDHEAAIQARLVGSADFREGLAALQQKRQPDFQGE